MVIFALHVWRNDPGVALAACHSQGPPFLDDQRAAIVSANDPAKLANLLAEALRRLGITVHDLNGGKLSYPVVELYDADNEVYMDIWHSMSDVERSANARVLAMPQARVALLRVLLLPEDSTAEDAVKALANAS